MVYHLEFQGREEYLYVFGRAEVKTLPESLRTLELIAERCHSGNYNRLLIEEDFGTQLAEEDIMEVVMAMMMSFQNIKVAVVDPRSSNAPKNDFGENVSVNRGIHLRVFQELAPAEQWLLSDAGASRAEPARVACPGSSNC